MLNAKTIEEKAKKLFDSTNEDDVYLAVELLRNLSSELNSYQLFCRYLQSRAIVCFHFPLTDGVGIMNWETHCYLTIDEEWNYKALYI